MRPIIGKIIRRGTENSDLNPDLCAVTDPAAEVEMAFGRGCIRPRIDLKLTKSVE